MTSTVTISGNLTRDPEATLGTNNRWLGKLAVAVNRRWQRDGEWHEQVSFFDVVVYGETAQHVAASLRKGDRCMVTGRLEQSTWQVADGTTKQRVQLVADDIGASLRYATCEPQRVQRQTAPAELDDF